MTEIEDDAGAVLTSLIEAQDEGLRAGGQRQYEYIPATRLASDTGLPNDRVEYAVDFLEQHGYADVIEDLRPRPDRHQPQGDDRRSASTSTSRTGRDRRGSGRSRSLWPPRLHRPRPRREPPARRSPGCFMQLHLEPVILQRAAEQGADPHREVRGERGRRGLRRRHPHRGRLGLAAPDESRLGPKRPTAPVENVVLEMGYFMRALGRSRVAALVKRTVTEQPSDIHGIVYIRLDDGRGLAAPTRTRDSGPRASTSTSTASPDRAPVARQLAAFWSELQRSPNVFFFWLTCSVLAQPRGACDRALQAGGHRFDPDTLHSAERARAGLAVEKPLKSCPPAGESSPMSSMNVEVTGMREKPGEILLRKGRLAEISRQPRSSFTRP